jgi:hypothetical protein
LTAGSGTTTITADTAPGPQKPPIGRLTERNNLLRTSA